MINFLDIVSIIVIVVFAVSGYKKGVLKTVISTVGTLLCWLISSVLSKPIAEAIYNGGFKSAIVSKTESALKLTAQEGGSFIENLMTSLPNFVGNSLAGFNINTADISNSAAKSGAAQVEKILAPVVISFISVIVAGVLFCVLLAVVKIICKLIYNTMDDSPLNIIDAIAGGIVSIAEAFIILMAASFILRIATPHMAKVPEVISDTSISESLVYKGIYNSHILTELVADVTDSPNTDLVD